MTLIQVTESGPIVVLSPSSKTNRACQCTPPSSTYRACQCTLPVQTSASPAAADRWGPSGAGGGRGWGPRDAPDRRVKGGRRSHMYGSEGLGLNPLVWIT